MIYLEKIVDSMSRMAVDATALEQLSRGGRRPEKSPEIEIMVEWGG